MSENVDDQRKHKSIVTRRPINFIWMFVRTPSETKPVERQKSFDNRGYYVAGTSAS